MFLVGRVQVLESDPCERAACRVETSGRPVASLLPTQHLVPFYQRLNGSQEPSFRGVAQPIKMENDQTPRIQLLRMSLTSSQQMPPVEKRHGPLRDWFNPFAFDGMHLGRSNRRTYQQKSLSKICHPISVPA